MHDKPVSRISSSSCNILMVCLTAHCVTLCLVRHCVALLGLAQAASFCPCSLTQLLSWTQCMRLVCAPPPLLNSVFTLKYMSPRTRHWPVSASYRAHFQGCSRVGHNHPQQVATSSALPHYMGLPCSPSFCPLSGWASPQTDLPRLTCYWLGLPHNEPTPEGAAAGGWLWTSPACAAQQPACAVLYFRLQETSLGFGVDCPHQSSDLALVSKGMRISRQL